MLRVASPLAEGHAFQAHRFAVKIACAAGYLRKGLELVVLTIKGNLAEFK
jgi:hypothetical protein